MKTETIHYQLDGGVAVITLNRPARNNAINSLMSRELAQVWQHFNQDSEAIVAILTGQGKAFCSGADIGDLPDIDLSSAAAAKQSTTWTSLQNNVWKPVICAVNGVVVGGGLHFVADSDIVIAADTASFFDSHVSVGLVSGVEPVGLARRMPIEAVLRMALLGSAERVSAERALQCGLVGEVVAADQLMTRALQLARHMVGNCPSAMARTKKAIWAAKQQPLDAAVDFAWEQIVAHNQSPDFTEGLRAFQDGRPPLWQPYRPD